MTVKFKYILSILGFCVLFGMFAVNSYAKNDSSSSSSDVVSKRIPPMPLQEQVSANEEPEAETPEAVKRETAGQSSEISDLDILADEDIKIKDEHYDSKGKIDPFKPLIQEKPEVPVQAADERPKRILTPLEKIELNQLKLVAVINMENRSIAMVEEASGKGYEVKVGTYMGKNQGKVSEIKTSSILVKELVRDYKGKLNERITEIKLNKSDDEE